MKHVCNLKSIRKKWIYIASKYLSSIIQHCLKFKKEKAEIFHLFFAQSEISWKKVRLFKFSTQNAQSFFFSFSLRMLSLCKIRCCRRTLSIVYWYFGVVLWKCKRTTWLSSNIKICIIIIVSWPLVRFPWNTMILFQDAFIERWETSSSGNMVSRYAFVSGAESLVGESLLNRFFCLLCISFNWSTFCVGVVQVTKYKRSFLVFISTMT